MNVLIIEDEARAANQLQNMLISGGFQYVLLGIIDTIEDAVQWFEINPSPDLVFMDIQLADGLSFEIFQKVEVEAPIIFTTAYDQYAIQAFKVNSIDYLLKPIQKEDLGKALEKFQKSTKALEISPKVLKQLLTTLQTPPKRQGILVKEGSSFVQVSTTDVLYFYSENSITFGVTNSKRFIVEETIDQLFTTLDPQDFFRINRGQLIARKAIIRIAPHFNHRLKLKVQNDRGHEFVVSRNKTNDFKTWANS
jgi:DNA-binding LytR/AlgR family response regulator